MPSIGLVCNVFEEVNAISGLLESASQFFDDLLFYHCGPGGEYSKDGTIEIIEKWGARIVYGAIDEGFGVVRTKAVRLSTCEFAMILDADERFHYWAPLIGCHGTEGYPQVQLPDLRVEILGEPYNQGHLLRTALEDPNIDAVQTARRHWFDFSWRHPCQNWTLIADWQMRVLRNCDDIGYDSSVKMHERVVDRRTGHNPRAWVGDTARGPFHDHYHCFFKPMEPEQRARDVAVYNALHEGSSIPGREPPIQGACAVF